MLSEMSAAHNPKSGVSVTGVSKSYGPVNALIDATLTIEQDESVAILGPSGSGKSTLLGIIAGFIEPDCGKIVFNGKIMNRVPTYRRGIGMVFQRYALFPNQTVFENLAFALKIRSVSEKDIKTRVSSVLDMVGLTALQDRVPAELSGGQAQRVALARALVHTPQVLLMDEPLGALDKQLRTMLQMEIKKIQKISAVPTIYVTHDQDEAMHLADRIILIRDGRIVADDKPSLLYQFPKTVWAAKFLGDANIIPADYHGPADDRLCSVTSFGRKGKATDMHAVASESDGVSLILRPEDGSVLTPTDTAHDADGITIPAQVIFSTFLGGRQRVVVQGPDGITLAIELPGRAKVPNPGENITCFWPGDSAILVADREFNERDDHAPETDNETRTTHAEYDIHNRDFMVNAIWEGAGDELHSNDLYAAKTPFGARIISGLALTCLGIARKTAQLNWAPPARLQLVFDSAVKSGDTLALETIGTGETCRINVNVGDRRAMEIRLEPETAAPAERSAGAAITKGRTFTSGDREVFDWWLSTSLPGLPLAPAGVVPWPIIASATSGFISRIEMIKTPHLSLVNRSNTWRFHRNVAIGETLHAELSDTTERLSKSRDGWGIWTGKVLTVSDTDCDVVATTDWTCMFTVPRKDAQK